MTLTNSTTEIYTTLRIETDDAGIFGAVLSRANLSENLTETHIECDFYDIWSKLPADLVIGSPEFELHALMRRGASPGEQVDRLEVELILNPEEDEEDA